MKKFNMRHHPNGFWYFLEDTHASRWIAEQGRLDHDLSVAEYLCRYIKPNDIVLDIGANIGTHTIRYAATGARVLAFEPNPQIFECLKRNVGHKVECFQKAASDVDGLELLLNVNEENFGATPIGKTGTPIKTMTIDSLNLPSCNFVKIDVEGHEPKVLKGMQQTIRKYHPIMFIEVQQGMLGLQGYKPEDIYSELRSYGYKCSLRGGQQPAADCPQCDILAV